MAHLAPPPQTPSHLSTDVNAAPLTPTTDFAVFEAQKENIQPLNTGRSAAVLSGLYTKEKMEAERIVVEGHERCRKDIEEAERREAEGEEMIDGTADVLDPYCRYVNFIHQHHPTSPTLLLTTLESITRKFISDSRFHQDSRYLKLWSQYAKLVESGRQEDVWVFLNGKEVGTNWAGFYEDWAGAAEGRGRRQEADRIYMLGINRKAQPLKRLQQAYQAFLARPPVIPSTSSSTLVNPSNSSATGGPGGRRVLTSRTPSGSSASTTTHHQQQSHTSYSSTRPPNASRIDVFSDASADAASAQQSLPWEDIGTRDGVRKENEREATGWKGEMLKQDKRAMARVAPRTPKLEVFNDEPEPRSRSTGEEFSAPGSKNKSNLEAEALRTDPLKFYTSSTSPVALPPIPSSLNSSTIGTDNRNRLRKVSAPTPIVLGLPWTIPDEAQEMMNAKGKMERKMFVWDEVYEGGMEWSNEEIRAKKMVWGGSGSGSPIQEWEMEWHGPEGAPQTKPVEVYVQPASIFFDVESQVPVQFASPTTSPTSNPTQALPTPSQPTAIRGGPSPTVNTKAAMADVFELFNQDVKGGRKPAAKTGQESDDDDDSDEDADNSSDDDEEDDSKATRMALPQPTPAGAGVIPARMGMGMATPGGYIPPTPTPAPGYLHSRRDPALGVFSEENEPPQTSIKLKVHRDESEGSRPRLEVFSDESSKVPQPKLNVFSDENAIPGSSSHAPPIAATPAKGRTPLAAKQPLAAKVPSAYSDTDVERQTAAPTGPAPSAVHQAAAYATPIRPDQRGRVSRAPNIFSSEMAEEQEEEAEPREFQGDQNGMRDYQQAIEPSGDKNGKKKIVCLKKSWDAMTPVTERTESYTRSTLAGLNSSTSSALTSATRGHTRQMSGDSDERMTDDEDELELPMKPSKEADLSTVKEESETTGTTHATAVPLSPAAGRRSPSPTMASSSGGTPSGYERSGTIEAPFTLSPGYTIAQQVPTAEKEPFAPALVETPSRGESGEFNPRNPCCPVDEDVLLPLLATLDPPLEAMDGFVDMRHQDCNHLSSLQRFGKSRGLSASTKSSSSEPMSLTLDGKEYEVEQKIGEGGFGAVFKAIDLEARDIADDADDGDDDLEDQYIVALKVEKPANVWESVVLTRMRSRMPESSHPSIIRSRGLYCFRDESFLVLDYHSQGTLLDAVNNAAKLGISTNPAIPASGMDEIPAIFFTIELLKIVEQLHRADFIHGDLKIDNCLIRLSDSSDWSAQYDRSGSNGWSAKGVRLIDFGRAIDLRLYPRGRQQTFVADWPIDARDCQEIREGKPWNYQTDYFGMASICYCMLFGKYIATELVPGDGEEKRYKISGVMKRYWQSEIWNDLFDLLLNPKLSQPDGALPITDQLASVRARFEDWLEGNCQKGGKNLKSMLIKIEMGSM